MKKIEIRNAKAFIKSEKSFYEKWQTHLKNINFLDYDNYKKMYCLFFKYFQEQPNADNSLINIYYDNASKLNVIYEDAKNSFRQQGLENIEKNYKEYFYNLKRNKQSVERIKAGEKLEKMNKELKKIEKIKVEYSTRSRNIFENLLMEMIFKAKYFKSNRIQTIDFEIFNHNLKHKLIIRKQIKCFEID